MENIKIIKYEDVEYPKKLLNIKKPPKQLYVLGNTKLLNKTSIAIIGSRNCTEYGYNNAIKFAKELAKNDITIISGMAIGIDSGAHIGAKDEIGKTVAVLGGGFNNIFPEENEDLFYEILEKDGCIISEYSPECIAESKNFPIRNRIISGLSDGVLVIEAKEKSGSTITARIAKEQGKKLYCIPGNINSKLSIGTGKLIQNGAKLVLDANDILEEFGIKIILKEEESKKIKVDRKYKEIYDLISKVPISINTICKRSNKNMSEINIAITMLELQGAIKQVGINEYVINN